MSAAIRKRPITRNRETLTCSQCRARKLKCDKHYPCGSCVRRNEQASCSYANTKDLSVRADVPEDSRVSKAEARLQHLELLVQEYAQTKDVGPSPSVSISNGLQTGNETPTYVGGTHYMAMLEGIEELRQVLAEEDMALDNSTPGYDADINETDILFGGASRLPLAVILADHLPTKLEVDRRIAAYFRAEAIAAPFIHVPQFMRQYEQFWANKMETSPLWISMLFSICILSQSTGRGAGVARVVEGASHGHLQRNFSLAAAQCLTLGQYHKPQRFAVEALGVYLQAKIVGTLDLSFDIGTLFSTLIQLAYSMGYHKDPDHFKHITVFEGELRRRAWSFCMQLDLLVSFQLGLPNNVQSGSWNTRIPSNFQDSDIDEHMILLPPPRSCTEATKITFYTAKHQLMTIFDKILKHALSIPGTGSKPVTDLLALDAELNATYHTIPPIFHYKPVEASLTDPVSLITTRKCVQLMYQKCRCVLHRQHIAAGRQESAWICFEAATGLVRSFLELYPEWKPGGQFFEDRWLLGSITWNDFLLGVMVLCLVFCQNRKSGIPSLSAESYLGLVGDLKAAMGICGEKLEVSVGARRTNRLLEALLLQMDVDDALMSDASIIRSFQLDAQVPPGSSTMAVPDAFQGWTDPLANVFETQEWSFLGHCLNTNFDA